MGEQRAAAEEAKNSAQSANESSDGKNTLIEQLERQLHEQRAAAEEAKNSANVSRDGKIDTISQLHEQLAVAREDSEPSNYRGVIAALQEKIQRLEEEAQRHRGPDDDQSQVADDESDNGNDKATTESNGSQATDTEQEQPQGLYARVQSVLHRLNPFANGNQSPKPDDTVHP